MIVTACQGEMMCFAQFPKQAWRPILTGFTQDTVEKPPFDFPTESTEKTGLGAGAVGDFFSLLFLFSALKNILQ